MDSRHLKPGDLFIAVPGLTVDGRDYIDQAIAQGAAAAVVGDFKYAGYIAAGFFDKPSDQIPVIGITGTSGKTSISHFIAQIFSYCHQTCGMIGTLGIGFLGNLHKSVCTTPNAVNIQKSLRAFCDQGASTVTMEVSSHALDQHRVSGLNFHTAIFTNLSRDHLDYHPSMQHYAEAKYTLFTDYPQKASVINLDDEYGQKLISKLAPHQHERRVIGYTTQNFFKKEGIEFVKAQDIIFDDKGVQAQLQTPWGSGILESALLGAFNLSNVLAALIAVCLQRIPLEQALDAIRRLQMVPGRLMRFGGDLETPLVVVDYAHKPDALEKVLEALREHCRGRIWCVVGCGGDRDRGKRPLMASIAENLSDVLYFTQDNSRTEDPASIFADMIKGLKNPEKVIIEWDRKCAIEAAIQKAKPEDLVVVAGKGHEDYQIIGTKSIPYSDQSVVEAALFKKKNERINK